MEGPASPGGLGRPSSACETDGQCQLGSRTLVPAGSTHRGDRHTGVANSPPCASHPLLALRALDARAVATGLQLEILVEKEGGVQRDVKPGQELSTAAWQAAVPPSGVSSGETPLPLPSGLQKGPKGSKSPAWHLWICCL